MSAELLLCVSQNEAEIPYQFSITRIRVYSFEEALYHIYHYWKESLEDFLSPAFIGWVRDALSENYLASKMEELNHVQSLKGQVTAFLGLGDYLNKSQIREIEEAVGQWEKRLEWERLKDMGDFLMKKGETQRAYGYYKKALYHDSWDNKEILNNMGIALMRLELYPEAVQYLAKAYQLDKENLPVILNYAEALIYSKDFERAFKYLKKAETFGEDSLIYYFYGLLCVESGNLPESVDYLNRAIAMNPDNSYYYLLGDVYSKMGKLSAAMGILEKIQKRDEYFYIRHAALYAAANDYAQAIKSIERVLAEGTSNNCYLWTMLAMYCRLDQNLEKAETAIIKAVSINPEDKHAKLEQARIKKAQGKTKDYQVVLNRILQAFKNEYRKITEG